MGRKPVLLDRFGRPVQRAALTTELSAATFGGVRSPTTGYPGDGLDPVRLASILRQADMGHPIQYLELAETIEERDLHYVGLLGTRRRQVSQLEITVEPADDSAEALRRAKEIEDWMDRDELSSELFDILDAVGKGFSFTEIIWDTSSGDWMPERLEHRDPRWFRFDKTDLRTPMKLGPGGSEEPLDAFKFIFGQIKTKSGLPLRSGLARVAFWAYLFKKYTERDWSIFSQTYGQPLRLGKYENGATEKDKNTLYRAVADIAGDCAGIIPRSMEIEFIEAGNVGSASGLYKERAEWYDRQVSKAVLGQTATSDADTGGLGSGEEHGKVREDIEKADAKDLAAFLNRDLIAPWHMLNYGTTDLCPRLRIGRPESEDLKAFADAIAPFIDRGLKVTPQEIYDKFKLSAPGTKAEFLHPAGQTADVVPLNGPASVLKRQTAPIKQQPEPAGADTPDRASSRPTGRSGGLRRIMNGVSRLLSGTKTDLHASSAAEMSAPRDIVTALSAPAGAEMQAMLERLEVMVQSAGSFEELRAMFESAYPDLDTGQLARILGDGMTMADAAGRIEVAEGDG